MTPRRLAVTVSSRREFVARSAAWAAVSAVSTHGQGAVKPLVFDAFSIRTSGQDAKPANFQITPDGLLTTGSTMRQLLQWAYWPAGQNMFQSLPGAPGWVASDRFAVIAKVSEEDAPAWQAARQNGKNKPLLESALQAALAERCGLVVHRVPKEIPSFELVVGKKGVKMTPTPVGAAVPDGYRGNGEGFRMKQESVDGLMTRTFFRTTVGDLIRVLTGPGATVVTDKTGLTGQYNFVLMAREVHMTNDGTVTDPNTMWDLDALGLHVEATKPTIDMIVIDHIERPSAN